VFGFRLRRSGLSIDGQSGETFYPVLTIDDMAMLAGEIGVVIVREEKKSSRLEASELLRHLQRHSLIANISTRDEDDIPTAIAAEAEAWRASVLIMGAYGHSRIREIVFGGVTRFMLTATRVPTIMVH
jgi:nucleotide-binding universal stress UspA family protein